MVADLSSVCLQFDDRERGRFAQIVDVFLVATPRIRTFARFTDFLRRLSAWLTEERTWYGMLLISPASSMKRVRKSNSLALHER